MVSPWVHQSAPRFWTVLPTLPSGPVVPHGRPAFSPHWHSTDLMNQGKVNGMFIVSTFIYSQVQYLFLYSNLQISSTVYRKFNALHPPYMYWVYEHVNVRSQLQWPTIWVLIILLKFLTLIIGIELIIWRYYLLLLIKHCPLLIPDPSRANVRKIILHTSYNNIFKHLFFFLTKLPGSESSRASLALATFSLSSFSRLNFPSNMVKAFIASSGFSSPLMSKDNSKLTKNAKQRDNHPHLYIWSCSCNRKRVKSQP